MPPCDADHVLVLAAGRGRRMGGPKALMAVGAASWWELQRRRLDATNLVQTWLVSADVHQHIADHPEAPERLIEANADSPMFDTVMRGARSLPNNGWRGLFVHPIDVPVPSTPVWNALADTGRCAVPVHCGQRGHPIYMPAAWVRSRLLDEPPTTNARLDELVRHDRVEVEVDDPDIVINLNTPADLDAWRRSTGSKA